MNNYWVMTRFTDVETLGRFFHAPRSQEQKFHKKSAVITKEIRRMITVMIKFGEIDKEGNSRILKTKLNEMLGYQAYAKFVSIPEQLAVFEEYNYVGFLNPS